MRQLISFCICCLFFITNTQGQDLGAAPAKGAPVATKDIAIKLNKSTGKIDLYNVQQNVTITDNYKLSHLELEIFDSSGEYAGSLELKDFLIPANEVDKSENVKIAKIKFKNTSTGEEMTLSNVNFAK